MTTEKKWPETLYHYTSSRTFLSILESDSVWLSGRWNLNDSQEGEVFCACLRERAMTYPDGITKANVIIEELRRHESYVCCFSSERDMLSQWRGYAQDGAGVSIGFDTTCLIDIIRGSTDCMLKKVSYARSLAELSPESQQLTTALLERQGVPRKEFMRTVASEMWSVKSPAFAEEAEYRLVLSAEPGVPEVSLPNGAVARLRHRPTDVGLREHYALSLGSRSKRLITEVVLGPRNDSSIEVAERCLATFGLAGVRVCRSSASYR